MFRRQFRVARDDFSLLETAILEKMERKGYDFGKHASYATQSSSSPITLELWLYITLWILSGASYLDMIWYAVEVRSVSGIFWRMIYDIDEAVDNLNFPTDEVGRMQLVDNWSAKRKDHHGFTTNMGTALAVDGFVIETVKPYAKRLQGQDVGCYRNCKGVWGLISQVGCDANAKIEPSRNFFVLMLKNRQLPDWVHIISDEAYSPLSAECSGQILTRYSQHQLNTAKQNDWQNLQDWEDRGAQDRDY